MGRMERYSSDEALNIQKYNSGNYDGWFMRNLTENIWSMGNIRSSSTTHTGNNLNAIIQKINIIGRTSAQLDPLLWYSHPCLKNNCQTCLHYKWNDAWGCGTNWKIWTNECEYLLQENISEILFLLFQERKGSIPRCTLQSHSTVHRKNNSYFVGIGNTRGIEIMRIFRHFYFVFTMDQRQV